jgi:hypothetical protein
MERYIEQLLEDIDHAIANNPYRAAHASMDIWDWMSDEEEDKTAPVRNLQDLTGIQQGMLPPGNMLSNGQLGRLLAAIQKMLDEFNWSVVLQTKVPEHVQYEAIRTYFNQEVRIKRWHHGFFELCRPGTVYKTCKWGEYCQCAFYAELYSEMTDEELSPEEERARLLEIEINHLKRKYDDDWMRYYPYHLDAGFDDEDGNPYDYGWDDLENEDW